MARGTRLSRRVLRLPQTRGVKPIGQFGVVNQKALQGCPTKHGVPVNGWLPESRGVCRLLPVSAHPGPYRFGQGTCHLIHPLIHTHTHTPQDTASPALHHHSSHEPMMRPETCHFLETSPKPIFQEETHSPLKSGESRGELPSGPSDSRCQCPSTRLPRDISRNPTGTRPLYAGK